MELKCKVIQSLGISSGMSKAGKEWKRATVIFEHGEQYTKTIAVVNMKNAEDFAKLQPGMVVKLYIDFDSREFQGKWYTTVSAWKWEVLSGAQSNAQPAYGQPTYNQPAYSQQNFPQQGTQADPFNGLSF